MSNIIDYYPSVVPPALLGTQDTITTTGATTAWPGPSGTFDIPTPCLRCQADTESKEAMCDRCLRDLVGELLKGITLGSPDDKSIEDARRFLKHDAPSIIDLVRERKLIGAAS